jgi:hypothetical protein
MAPMNNDGSAVATKFRTRKSLIDEFWDILGLLIQILHFLCNETITPLRITKILPGLNKTKARPRRFQGTFDFCHLRDETNAFHLGILWGSSGSYDGNR